MTKRSNNNIKMEMIGDDDFNPRHEQNANQFFDDFNDDNWILEKPISVFALDPADRRVLKVADQRDAVQKKTFTKWINFHLSKREGLHVDDLFLDLRDGHLLISLLEIFTNQIIPRERGTSKFHALQNIEQCLHCLEQDHNIRLVNIRPEELVNGNPKLTLGLLWRIILHFQFSDISIQPTEVNIPVTNKQTTTNNSTNNSSTLTEVKSKPVPRPERKSSTDQISSNYRNMLLIWARQQCQGYPGIYIEDFTRSWRNGRAFLAILHRHNPHSIDMQKAYRQSNRENLQQAFDFAQQQYGIMQLIDPEDVDTDDPDEKSILLYIAHLYKVCPTVPTHPYQHEHDRIYLEAALSNEYTSLASDLLQWLKIKLDFLNSEMKFKTLDDIERYQDVLQVIRHDEMRRYHRILYRMRAIDAEFETLQLNQSLQPDIESIHIAWNKFEVTLDRVEQDLKQFIEQYQQLKEHFDKDLDLIERDIAQIERAVEMKSRQLDSVVIFNQLNQKQMELDQILNNCRTFSLPYEQVQSALERIDQLHLRIDHLQAEFNTSPKKQYSSPTTLQLLDSHSTSSNGFHSTTKRQGRSQQPSNFVVQSGNRVEQLDVIVTGDYRRSTEHSQPPATSSSTRSTTKFMDSEASNNERTPLLLVEELDLVEKNLHTLGQLLQQRLTRLLQSSLPTSHDDLLLLYREHKDFENDLLSQASRIQEIRNLVRQEYTNSSHQDLRSLINQTSDHAQDLFTRSKTYSDKLDIVDMAISLVTDLTGHIIELETRLASQLPLINDESHLHRQLDELHSLEKNLQMIEKSIEELLQQSKQLANERFLRISEQLVLRWKQIQTEINQRKRSITQCMETQRSFATLYEQEELILDNLQQRVQTLEPIPTDANQIRFLAKPVADLFNEILGRAQAIEHMNDVAVKFIEEAKMHDKTLKHFRVSLRDLHPSLDASVAVVRRQYPANIQRATRATLQVIEVFDRRYADLLAQMEEYGRLLLKAAQSTGQTVHLPVDSASSIVHLYRSTIASRYNITLQSLLSSSDEEDEKQSTQRSSAKRTRQHHQRTGFIDLTRGKVTVDQQNQGTLSSLDGPVSVETTYVIPTSHSSTSVNTDQDLLGNKKVRVIVQKQVRSSPSNGHFVISSVKSNNMTQRQNLSFVDAVNNKYLNLSTGLFSSPSPFVLSSSASTSVEPHRHSHTHFSSSITTSSPPSVNNHPSLVGAETTSTTTANTNATITLKQAIDANILDAHSAYVVDTLEQRNYNLRDAYTHGLISSHDHRIIDRARNQPLTLADALKMGVLKLGDAQPYNIISKTESLVISSVLDHRLGIFIDPSSAIRKKILDPYHGSYVNNLTQESISIDDAMNRGFIIVEQQSSAPHSNQANEKYVISTSLIRETRSFHLLGVRDYVNNRELSVQEAIRLGILDKQNGQYINRKTGEVLSISEAIAQGHIRAQPLPVEGAAASTLTTTTNNNTQETISNANVKRGTVKETKTYTLKSAIHPKTRKEIPIRQAIDEGIIDHAKGFYVNTLTGETLPISVAIERGLIFTELTDQHARRVARTFVIEHVIDPVTNQRLTVNEGIRAGLINSSVTHYYHPVHQRQMTLIEALDQRYLIGRFVDQIPNTFITDQRHQISYLITNVRDSRTDKVYHISEAVDRRLFDRQRVVYIQPTTGEEIPVGEAIKRDLVQVQAVASQITDQRTEHDSHSKVSIHIESRPQTSTIHHPGTSQVLKSEKEIIEIEAIPNAPRHRRRHRTTTEEEIIEQHTTNIVDKEVFINRGRSTERPRQRHIEEVVIDDRHRRDTVDIPDERRSIHHRIVIEDDRRRPIPPPPQPQPPQRPDDRFDEQQQSWSEEEWEQWHCILMIKDQPYRVVWVMNTATGDRLPLQNAYQRGLVDTKQRLFFDEKLNRQAYSFERAVELGYMGIEPDKASLPIRVDGIEYMIHWVLEPSTKRRIYPRPAIAKQILDAKHGRYVNPYNNSQVSLHEAIHLKFIGATEYGSTSDSITVNINGQPYTIKWVYDTRHMKKILPRDALKQGIIDLQLNEYRKFDTNDVMSIYDAIQAGYIRCNDDDSSSDNSVKPPSIISIDEDELTIATKTATYVITSVIHPLTQKEIKVSEAIDLGILDKETGSYRDLATNVQYELAEAINEGLVYATIIETKEDTEMMTSSVQEIVKKFIVKSVAIDSESQEKIGGLEAQAVGILNYAQGVYHDRKYGVKIPLDKAIERRLLDVELVSQKRFEEYDLELITDTITEKRTTLYKIYGVRNNVLDRMESGAVAVRNQMIDTEAKTYTDLSTSETMSIQEAVNRNLIQAEISEHVERKPLGLSMQNAIRLGFYTPETGTFRDPATEHYMTLMEAIERGHIHVNGVAFADSEQGPITLYDAFALGLINRRDGGKLNQAKINLYRARLVESNIHRMNVEDAIRCGLLNLRTGLYKHPHSGEQLNLKEAIQRGLIDGQSTVIENPSTGRFMTLKDALEGIRIDNEGQVVDSYSNKVITTLEVAFNHRKLFSQFDINAGEIFLPAQNESVGFEKAIRKNLLDNNKLKLFDPKTNREYTIQDAIERGLIEPESGLVYDQHSRTQYSIREAIRHGIIAVVGAPLVPIKADHETVAAKITSRNRRRHSLAKSSLHFDYHSAPDSADEDSHGSGGWHRVTTKAQAISPLSFDGKRSLRRRTGSSPSRHSNRTATCRDDDSWLSNWRNRKHDDDDDDDDTFGGSRRFANNNGNQTFNSTTTTTTTNTNQKSTNGDSSQRPKNDGRSSTGFQQKEQDSSLPASSVLAKDDSPIALPSLSNVQPQTTELLEHKSELSYFVPPTTQVYQERSKTETITDDESSDRNQLISIDQKTVVDESSKSDSIVQDSDNQVIVDMHDVASRLTSLHDQLNQYVYLSENLHELKNNVQQIQKIHSNVENEKSTINQLIERSNQINPQLASLSEDLEEKRGEISDINSSLSSIIERFVKQVEQFNGEHSRLTDWLETNDQEIQKALQLENLTSDNEKFKGILHAAIHLQNDFQGLDRHLQEIEMTIVDFEQATGNTDGGKSAKIYRDLQQRSQQLNENYSDFVKRCKHLSDQCERSLMTYNEVNHLNDEIQKSINEFHQNLTEHPDQSENNDKLQSLLVNVQQQLDKLSLLATHEPASPSPVMSTSTHIQNAIKEHLCNLLDNHNQHYQDAQQGLLQTLEQIEHDQHERQTVKERLDELYNWLLSYTDNSLNNKDCFAKKLSLKRSKLDEQMIQFRQFHSQLRTRRHSFDSQIQTTTNLDQLLETNDKKLLNLIDQQFQLLDQQAHLYNERINRFSTRLNEFHLEHVHLIDDYEKRLRLYVEHFEQNAEMNFSTLQMLINDDEEMPIDQSLYQRLIKELLETEDIEDEQEIHQYEQQLFEKCQRYENFLQHLKDLLRQRHELLTQYESNKSQIHDWLVNTDRLLKQQPMELTLERCEQLLNEHSRQPIDSFRTTSEKLVEFYSSNNLFKVYELLNLPTTNHLHSTSKTIFQRQTDDLCENHHSIRERIVHHMEIVNEIHQQLNQYQTTKDKAEKTIEKAKELVTMEENTILPLDNEQIEAMLNKYKTIADQLKLMSANIDTFKSIGLTLINTAERYIDIEPIQNEITNIDRSWSEYVEYILDTMDYIELHQEDLQEFQELSNNLLTRLNHSQSTLETLDPSQLKQFHDELEKSYEQVELLNQKGEILLQSSPGNQNEENENQIERLLENINRNYDSLTIKSQVRLEQTEKVRHSTPSPTSEEEIPPMIREKLTDEIRHHIDETNVAMNELSELLVSSANDTISAQPMKLAEQLIDNGTVQNELERRKMLIEQLNCNVETLKELTTNGDDFQSIENLQEKLHLLNDHWLIMKRANDLRTENLLLTQACANQFWSEQNELHSIFDQLDKELSQLRPRSTSREHIESEKKKYQDLIEHFAKTERKFRVLLDEHSLQLLTLISNNPEECEEIHRTLTDLQEEFHRIQTNFQTSQNEFEQAMIESAEFNGKLERVSHWFDDTSFPTAVDENNEFERIRTFKEHLDCKYFDIVHLKQDYTDIEQHRQQPVDLNREEKEKTNLVEEQLGQIDSKWSTLNEQIQEHKTLIYETAIRQNRLGDVINDIERSLEVCLAKLIVLSDDSRQTHRNDMKSIEFSIAKLRILLNDIELISYDIEQLKQSDSYDRTTIETLNGKWENLLREATEKYQQLEQQLEQMKLKQKNFEHIDHQLDLIDQQVTESTMDTKFPLLIENLENLELQIDREFHDDQHEQLRKRLIDVKQRTISKGQELIELAHSIELFHSSLHKFTEWLTETERHLNHQKTIPRRFVSIANLLKQIDDHQALQNQLETYKEHLIDLDKLATHLKFVSPKKDSVFIRNSMVAVQTRWQRILTRTTERTKELQKAFQLANKSNRSDLADIDRIKNEVSRQASMCQCSKKYDVQQVAEGRYRFGESQSLRLVRILRSTVMVRVGGGWTALDEFLVRHDPCRAKGRTNYDLHPESYALRDGVAQTMTLFKPRLVTVHRPTCLFHQQQLAAAAAAAANASASGTAKSSPATTPLRPSKEKYRRTSSINSFSQQQQQTNSSLAGDLSASGDDLLTSPHLSSDSEMRPSLIPVPVSTMTPVSSTLSRTSSRESVLSEHSIASTSSTQQRRPSKLPLPISRQKKSSNGSTPVKNP